MIKNIELQGKIVKIEYVLPDKIKKFLRKNNLDENKLLKDSRWKQSLQEDFFQRKVSFTKAKLVINYLRLTQDNQIRVPLEGSVQGKKVRSATWVKVRSLKNSLSAIRFLLKNPQTFKNHPSSE